MMTLIPEIKLLADLIDGHLHPKELPEGVRAPAPENTTSSDEEGKDSDVLMPVAPN